MLPNFDPVDIFFQIIVLLFAICVRESARAWMADRLGDPTGRLDGRISLNPIVHIDPVGTILVPLILIVFGRGTFGWASRCPSTTAISRRLCATISSAPSPDRPPIS
jgi:Zn-dependent protease